MENKKTAVFGLYPGSDAAERAVDTTSQGHSDRHGRDRYRVGR
jgi:hypothetical protein